MSPFFSIIIPAYNCAHLISETLDSVFKQQFIDYEIIIVNDGSTDGTSEILDRYRSIERVTLIDQKNKGEGGARNRGIFAAKGKYLAFLDQDDLWFPWTLQTYYEGIQGNDYPNILIATGQEFRSVEEIENTLQERTITTNYNTFFTAAKDKYIPAGTPGTVVKTIEAQKAGGLSEDSVIGIDMEFYWKIGELKGVLHLLKPITVAIRRHDGNLQGNTSMAVKGVMLFIEKEHQQCYPGGHKQVLARRAIISRMARTVSIKLLEDGLISDALQIYLSTLGWHIRLLRLRYLSVFPLMYLYKRFIAFGK